MADTWDQFKEAPISSWDQFKFADQSPPTGMPASKPSLGRFAGLEARNVIQGAAAIPEVGMNAIGGGYNALANLFQGYHAPSRDANAPFRFSSAGQNISDILTNLGLPQPETIGEKLGGDVVQGMTGAGSGIAIGKALQRAASPVVQGIGRILAAQPVKQVLGGGGAGLGAGGAAAAHLPAPVQIAAGLAGGAAPFGIPVMATTAARIANRGMGALSGGDIQLLNPATEAERRIREAFLADGGPRAAAQTGASYANSGASTPSLLDVGGGAVRRLVRASAGGGGDAHNIATDYADRVRADLQDNATAAVSRMAPGNMTAAQTEAALTKGQADLASSQYAAPYAQPATVTPAMVDALQGPEGRGAISRAYVAARANRNTDQMAELKDLMDVAITQSGGANPITGKFQSLEQALGNLSSRSLDRVRIAMRDTGIALSKSDKRDIAGGYFGRVKDIDTALDQTPGLTDARANYRQAQQGIDAVPHGQTILTMPSDQYAAETARLAGVGGPPNIGTGLRAGAKQSILDAIERPAAGQTGVLNRLASGTGVERNLSNTFGAGRTAVFREAIRNEVQRLRNANFVSPETGSQTQLRGTDESLIGGFPTSIRAFMSNVADKFFRGISLTPAERAEIVRLGTSEADLRRFVTAQPMRARPTVSAIQAATTQGNTQ